LDVHHSKVLEIVVANQLFIPLKKRKKNMKGIHARLVKKKRRKGKMYDA